MKFGLSQHDWNILKDIAIDPLRSHGHRVFVFGSRARGDHQKFSDIDLLVEGKKPMPLGLLGHIRSELEESNLPIKVDIVEMSELADSYRDGAMRDRIEVFD